MKKRRVLVIDVGGSHVKLMISRNGKRRKFESGNTLRPRQLVTVDAQQPIGVQPLLAGVQVLPQLGADVVRDDLAARRSHRHALGQGRLVEP